LRFASFHTTDPDVEEENSPQDVDEWRSWWRKKNFRRKRKQQKEFFCLDLKMAQKAFDKTKQIFNFRIAKNAWLRLV
jgi:hypothetical protein